MDKHALLSPSSSHRWLKCTPSALLESLEPFQPPSIYAEEGTEAHFLSELKLSFMLGKTSPTEYDTRFESFMMGSKYYNSEFNEFVNDYCREVMAIVKEDYAGKDIDVYLEEKVEFADVVPEGSGTSDVIIVGNNFVHVIDLKFGKGIEVSAIENPQLRLYAIGALKKFRLKGSFSEVRMTIIQPRLSNITTDIMTVNDLYVWAQEVVIPAAELAYKGQGDLTPGEHCKFCKLKGKCESLANQQLVAAQKEFDQVVTEDAILEPRNMTPEMLARVLEIGPKFVDWFKDVISYTTAAMINEGLKVPGYKVVEGRSYRVITDPDAVAEKLLTAGFAESDIFEPVKLFGITTLEKNIGKKLFNELAKNYLLKPPGKPTIALETDARPAIDADKFKLVGQEFDVIENEDE